jgi:hypothetical protein
MTNADGCRAHMRVRPASHRHNVTFPRTSPPGSRDVLPGGLTDGCSPRVSRWQVRFLLALFPVLDLDPTVFSYVAVWIDVDPARIDN